MKDTPKEIVIDRTTVLQKDGMEINMYIAGVNSGVYEPPFVVSIRVWARKWIFKKFFTRKMQLSLSEMIFLRDELNKAIELCKK